MKRLILLIGLSYFTSVCLAQPELKGSPEELRQFLVQKKIVTLHSLADERAYSDRAVVGLVVTTESKQLSKSMTENRELRKKLAEFLVASGVSLKNIKSSKFSSSPQYGWFGSAPSSYKVINRLSITINDEQHLEKVKTKALESILKQKELYETRLGVTLTALNIRDSSIQEQATQGAHVVDQFLQEAISTRVESSSFLSKARGRARWSKEASFDEVKYQANIAVDFKID